MEVVDILACWWSHAFLLVFNAIDAIDHRNGVFFIHYMKPSTRNNWRQTMGNDLDCFVWWGPIYIIKKKLHGSSYFIEIYVVQVEIVEPKGQKAIEY